MCIRDSYLLDHTAGIQDGTERVSVRRILERAWAENPQHDDLSRLEEVEQKVSDIDLVVDSSTWGDSPAAEAQLTVIPPSSPLHAQILDRSFDPADLPNAQVWGLTVTTTAMDDIVLMRIRNGLDNIHYRYTTDSEPEPIYEHSQLPNTDDTWTYFNLAQFAAGLIVALQKRQDETHGRWKGELAGRALEQVDELVGDHPSAWPGSVFAIPHELPVEIVETTFRAFVQIPDGLYPTGTRMRIDMAGTKGSIVSINASPAIHTLNAAAMGNLLNSRTADGYVRGILEIIEAGSTNLIDSIDFHIPIIPSRKFRQLTGSSPHTVRVTDEEFMVVITHTDGSNVTYLDKTINRVLLTTTARRFGVVESNADQGNFNGQVYINANLNAAGTELTTSIGYRGVDSGNQGRYGIASVHAR